MCMCAMLGMILIRSSLAGQKIGLRGVLVQCYLLGLSADRHRQTGLLVRGCGEKAYAIGNYVNQRAGS